MDITVRLASAEDADQVRDVYYYAWLAAYPNEELGITVADIEWLFTKLNHPTMAARRAARLANPPQNELCWVATVPGEVVGVSRVVYEPEANHLQTLYVHPQYFRKGVGSALWRHVQSRGQPGKPWTLWVTDYNSRAQAFYRAMGFVETGESMYEERFMLQSGLNFRQIKMQKPAP